MVDDRYGRMEVMQMGEVWWRQKQRIRLSDCTLRRVVQQLQQMAATRREDEVAKAVAEVAEAEEPMADTADC